jgi:hypothetical protein
MYTIKTLRCNTWSKRWYNFCRIIFQTLNKPGWIFLSLNMKTMNKKTLYKLNIQAWCDVTLCHCINSSWSSEMSGMNYLTRHNIPEDLNLQQHYCENLKSPTVLALCTIKLTADLCGISSCDNNLLWNTNARMLPVEGNRLCMVWSNRRSGEVMKQQYGILASLLQAPLCSRKAVNLLYVVTFLHT